MPPVVDNGCTCGYCRIRRSFPPDWAMLLPDDGAPVMLPRNLYQDLRRRGVGRYNDDHICIAYGNYDNGNDAGRLTGSSDLALRYMASVDLDARQQGATNGVAERYQEPIPLWEAIIRQWGHTAPTAVVDATYLCKRGCGKHKSNCECLDEFDPAELESA